MVFPDFLIRFRYQPRIRTPKEEHYFYCFFFSCSPIGVGARNCGSVSIQAFAVFLIRFRYRRRIPTPKRRVTLLLLFLFFTYPQSGSELGTAGRYRFWLSLFF